MLPEIKDQKENTTMNLSQTWQEREALRWLELFCHMANKGITPYLNKP